MCIVISSLPWHGWSESVDIGPLSFLARKTFRNCLDKVKVFFRIAFTPVFHIRSQLIQSCIAYHCSSLLEQFYSVFLRQSNQFASHWPHDDSPSVSESLQALLDCLPSTFPLWSWLSLSQPYTDLIISRTAADNFQRVAYFPRYTLLS